MTVWCQALLLLCCSLTLVESSTPFTVLQRREYRSYFCHTRSTRIHVLRLQQKYKEERLGNQHLVDRSRHLKDLPLLSTDFNNWLNLTDWDRLHAAFWDLQAYWNMLEKKRKQLEREDKVTHTTLPQSIKNIQHELRDLMSKVSTKMSSMQSSWTKPTSPPHVDPDASSKTGWESIVEGYIILRDLDLYLTKLARDFLLLASKAHL